MRVFKALRRLSLVAGIIDLVENPLDFRGDGVRATTFLAVSLAPMKFEIAGLEPFPDAIKHVFRLT